MHKCMMQDTITATTILNLSMYSIDMLPVAVGEYFYSLRMFFRVLDLIGMLNTFSEIAYFVNVTIYKSDSFVFGKLLGKITKLVTQIALVRFTSSENYNYDISTSEEVVAL